MLTPGVLWTTGRRRWRRRWLWVQANRGGGGGGYGFKRMGANVESSEETSASEEPQSEDESDEEESERKKLGSTHLAKIVPELNRLKSMTPSNQKKMY